jgi:putative ABC transport system permease protein
MSAWTVPLRIARRELRGGVKGFRIFLACLALGVAAIATVQSVSRGIQDGLREDGRIILGGDIAVRTLFEPGGERLEAWLAARGRTELSAELRAVARTADDTSSVLVELKAAGDAYPLYGRVELADGGALDAALASRDGRHGIVVDPIVADRLRLTPGDTVRVGDAEFAFRGVIRREPDRASGSGFALAPRAMIPLAALEETRLIQPGSIVNWVHRVALPDGADAAAVRDELARDFPGNGWRVRDHGNAAPQVGEFIGRLALFLTLVGLTSLLVGGVGVGNAVRAYVDSRVRTIAILKCVGAEGAVVFRTYLALVMVLSLGGIAIGLAVGALLPALASELLADLLPIPTRIGIYPDALLFAAAFGVLVSLAFSLWPLGRSREVPAVALFRDAVQPASGRPRARYVVATAAAGLALAALAVLTADARVFAASFVGGAIAVLLAFRGAAWLVERGAARAGRPRDPGLRLAVANLHRPGNPTGAVVLSLGLGLTVLVAVALIEGNFSRAVTQSIPDRAPAFFFLDIQRDQLDGVREAALSQPGAEGFTSVPSLRGRIVAVNGMDPEAALVDPSEAWLIRGDRGLTYSATLPAGSEVIAGEFWPQDYRGPPLLSIADDVQEAFGIGPGATITLNVLGRNITATVANVREVRWQSLSINFAIVVSPGVLDAAPHTWLATVEAPQASEDAIQRAVATGFPNVTVIRVRDALDAVEQVLSDIASAVRLIAAVTLFAGTLVLAGAVAAGHRRRVWDAVVLKVLGATRRDVLRAFLLEYGLLGAITAVIAGAVGTLTAWAVLVFVMNQEWTFLPSAVLTTAAICTAITLAFGFVGTWRALSQPAAPLLRNE